MVNITIYPYGNANENQTSTGWNFTCQHGANECQGNLVETCVINLVAFDQSQYMDFVIDYETKLKGDPSDPFGTAQKLVSSGSYNVSWDALNACINGAEGNAWQHQIAEW
eukprot:CAMPEP_0202712746 /NCGR_PEP_ID=MMETSP1385-20130828/44888_1 /ASSEMBLY_ACC=CAM_ASM_000861 /TAXON_ID=933848 /ORGANISM="Elphidium margaritaceum" /LENGTH=109 /DNA_ID=CAMNT_0049372873 /DNA_START=173 /DNA_END=499 /DNA_ORIENTATION=+